MQQYVKREGGHIVQLDLGNYFMPLGPSSDLVNQFLTESLESLPLDVMNLAPGDLFMWKQLSAGKFATRIISTNLTPKDNGVTVPQRYLVVEVPGGKIGTRKNLRIGFLGLSDPALVKPNSGFVAADPLEAVSRIKAEVMKKADFLMVLADLPNKGVSIRLAKENPEIYAIMIMERAYIDPMPEQVNNAVLVWSMERGRYLGQLVFELDPAGNVTTFKPIKIPMDANVPEDQVLLKRQNELSAKVPASAH